MKSVEYGIANEILFYEHYTISMSAMQLPVQLMVIVLLPICDAFFSSLRDYATSLKNNLYYYFDYETCDDYWLPADMHGFAVDFQDSIFGQPLAQSVVVNAVMGHLAGRTRKALIFSFHGWPGTGKNFVSEHLARRLYRKGHDSSFYKLFNGRGNFPNPNQVDEYQTRVINEIVKTLKKCDRSMFVFDEVDMVPEGVLDVIAPFIDYIPRVLDVDPSKAIFILLSNRGGKEIAERSMQYWMKNTPRENYSLREFKEIIAKTAFNEQGGLHYSQAIKSHLISFYVPFLPLEKSHVRQCIESNLRPYTYVSKTDKEKIVQAVMSYITYTPGTSNSAGVYSAQGCKNVDIVLSMTMELYRTGKLKDEL